MGHSGTLLSHKISISSKINFQEDLMETNLSASSKQPYKASRETTKPKKHFISQQGELEVGGSRGPALSLTGVGGCIHSCTLSKFLRVNMHLLKWGVPRSTTLHRLCGFLCGAVVTGKINGQSIRGRVAGGEHTTVSSPPACRTIQQPQDGQNYWAKTYFILSAILLLYCKL